MKRVYTLIHCILHRKALVTKIKLNVGKLGDHENDSKDVSKSIWKRETAELYRSFVIKYPTRAINFLRIQKYVSCLQQNSPNVFEFRQVGIFRLNKETKNPPCLAMYSGLQNRRTWRRFLIVWTKYTQIFKGKELYFYQIASSTRWRQKFRFWKV